MGSAHGCVGSSPLPSPPGRRSRSWAWCGTSGVTNQIYQNVGTDLGGTDAEVGAEAPGEAAGAAASPVATYDSLGGAQRSSGEAPAVAGEDDGESFEPVTTAPTETSIFPILLVSGLAVIAVALLLRYVIVPRAG